MAGAVARHIVLDTRSTATRHAIDRSEPCERLAGTCNHDLLTRERLIEQRGELRLRFGDVDLHGYRFDLCSVAEIARWD